MVKTRRGDNTLEDSEMPGVTNANHASDDDDDDEVYNDVKPPRRRNLRSQESPSHERRAEDLPAVSNSKARQSTDDDDDDDKLFTNVKPTRKSLRTHESISPNRGEQGQVRHLRSHRYIGYSNQLSSDDSDDDMRRIENHNAEDSSPNIRRRSRRQTRKIRIQETHSSAEDEEEISSRSRRFRGRRYTPNKSYSFRSLSNGDEGPRRSGRQRTMRYTYNDWILEEQSHRDYRRHRERGSRRRVDASVNHSHYSLRRQKAEESKDDDEEDQGEEEVKIRPRRSGRTKVERDDSAAEAIDSQKDDEADDKDENDDEENEETKDGDEKDEKEEGKGDEDMYTRVKRNRRTRQSISFNDDVRPTRSRTKRNIITSNDESGSSEPDRPPSPRKGYHLRQRRPPPQIFQHQEPSRHSTRNFQRNRSIRYRKSSTSSSSSDSGYDKKKNRRHLTVGFSKDSKSRRGDPKKKGSTLADTDPMEINPDIKFENVGGLPEHIKSLKEMIVFPMLYTEVFDKFKITPPKGVLFHGPPGTGKTLLARALANECSTGTQKVHFFMRKGADCLSKWVGESERQLRLLFEEAYQKRPSIIFFDELDGLAPVRSCKQDQIHASIVSTLLALMDGLKERRDIIIIGATNRIDAIDPALRRPGRFDRELHFPLPAVKEREEILKIHMAKWEEKPPAELISHLAEISEGYCGADLKALCSEAVLQSLRRRYPQIYNSAQKLLLDTNQVTVQKVDFQRAKTEIVPAAHRMAKCLRMKLPPFLAPLLTSELERAVELLSSQFPHVKMKSASECREMDALVPHPRLLLTGNIHQAHTKHIAPALLLRMEHVTVHSLDMSSLHGTPGATPEEVCIQVFREAARQLPAVIYVPNMDKWFRLVPESVKQIFMQTANMISPHKAILLLATANESFSSDEMPEEITELFNPFRQEVFTSKNPGQADRRKFFTPLFLEKPWEPPKAEKPTDIELEVLPLAPPPQPRKLSEKEEVSLYKAEENSLRELRIFLRQTLDKLQRMKKYSLFAEPVDKEDAPDYYDIIKNPMDLSTMNDKINRHEYNCAAEFIADIDLICSNCLEYNPDRLLRSTACQFRDVVHAVIKAEMDTDFEEECQKISKSREQRKFDSKKHLIDFINIAPAENKNTETEDVKPGEALDPILNGNKDTINGEVESSVHTSTPTSNAEGKQRKRRSKWSSGVINRPKKKKANDSKEHPGDASKTDISILDSSAMDTSMMSPSKTSPAKSLTGHSPKVVTPKSSKDCVVMSDTIEVMASMLDATEEATQQQKPLIPVEPDREALTKLLEKTIDQTAGLPFAALQDLYSQLNLIINKYMKIQDKSSLSNELEKQLEKFHHGQRQLYKKSKDSA